MEWDWVATPEGWIALLTLVSLEIVLGIDNIVFISILADKLPASQRALARRLGLFVAMGTRLLLLLFLAWLMGLTKPLIELVGHTLSGRDFILIAGGFFLLAKSTIEIHDKLEGEEGHAEAKVAATFASVIVQIALLDLVFSLDSVITAVGMVDDISIMVIAIVTAVMVMMFTVNVVSDFISRHPTVKMLALSFLLLVGTVLIAEGLGFHVPKGYVYFAMAFSVFVEMLNLSLRRRRAGASPPVHLRQPYRGSASGEGDGAADRAE